MTQKIEIPPEVKDAMLLLDMGQRFALCHTDNYSTREGVKTLRPHIDVIKDWMNSISENTT